MFPSGNLSGRIQWISVCKNEWWQYEHVVSDKV